jgi:hypothetical protein
LLIYGYNLSWAIDIGRCASIWLLHDLLYYVDSVVCVLYLCYVLISSLIYKKQCLTSCIFCTAGKHWIHFHCDKLKKDEIAQVIASPVDKPYVCKICGVITSLELLTLADVQAFGCCTIFSTLLTVLFVSFTCVMSSFPLWSIPSSA